MKKFRITMFGAIALVIVLMTLFRSVTGRDNPLFDKGTATTFYAETEVGMEPDLKAENYFSAEEYDLEKIGFDLSGLDVQKEGTCLVPVFYDGKKTNCTISVKVSSKTERMPQTKAGMSDDAAISR